MCSECWDEATTICWPPSPLFHQHCPPLSFTVCWGFFGIGTSEQGGCGCTTWSIGGKNMLNIIAGAKKTQRAKVTLSAPFWKGKLLIDFSRTLIRTGLFGWNMIQRLLISRTEVERWVLLAGVVVDVGDAERLDGDGSDTQQQLTQQQKRVHHPLGGALLQAAALIGGWGDESALWLAEARAVITGGCQETERRWRV